MKRLSPWTPVRRLTLPFFRLSCKFCTSIILHPRFSCNTSTPGQLQLLELSFSNDAVCTPKDLLVISQVPFYSSVSQVFCRIIWPWQTHFSSENKDISQNLLEHWPSLVSARAFSKCLSFSDWYSPQLMPNKGQLLNEMRETWTCNTLYQIYEDVIDHCSYAHDLSSCKIETFKKNSGLNRIQTDELCDTIAVFRLCA